ncbi:MAG TPA: hypothetical protein VMJ30_03725 [Gemmatimonadales bacterium]|nr:hypothetical protein [Gemmatimonadales bacterium]
MTVPRRLPAVLGALLLAAQLQAQQQPIPPANPLVHWGKWGAAGLSLTLHLLAVSANTKANDAYHTLQTACTLDNSLCEVGEDGTYTHPASEALYQESLHQDRRARAFLVSGEVALLGTVALFVIDLTRKKGPPPDIPFNPEVTQGPDGSTRLGFRVAF